MTIEEIRKEIKCCKKILLRIQKENKILKLNKEIICEQLTTITETYDFKNCWVETCRFKEKNTKIYLVKFYDKQKNDKEVTIENIDWLNKKVIHKNFKKNNISTNIISNILYAIKDTKKKIKNNE